MTVTPAVATTVTGLPRRRRARDAVATAVDGVATTARAVLVRRKPITHPLTLLRVILLQKLEKNRKRTKEERN